MTVSTVVDHNDYTGNGVTTSFPYTFRIFKKTDLAVSVVDLSENITVLVLDTDYTVTNAGGYNGGNVVLTAPLANGWQISVARELEPTQETDLRNQGKFFAEVHEDAFDKLTMLIQQAYSAFRLSLRKPSSIANWYDALSNYIRNVKDPRDPQDAATKNYVDGLSNINLSRTLRTPDPIISLPGIEDRKNKIVAMDNSGNPLMVLPESGSAADVLIELAKPSGAGLSGFDPLSSYPPNTLGNYLAQVPGADNTGVNNSLDYFNAAIQKLALAGGGILHPEPGVYLISGGSVLIPSYITLDLRGCELKGDGANTLIASGAIVDGALIDITPEYGTGGGDGNGTHFVVHGKLLGGRLTNAGRGIRGQRLNYGSSIEEVWFDESLTESWRTTHSWGLKVSRNTSRAPAFMLDFVDWTEVSNNDFEGKGWNHSGHIALTIGTGGHGGSYSCRIISNGFHQMETAIKLVGEIDDLVIESNHFERTVYHVTGDQYTKRNFIIKQNWMKANLDGSASKPGVVPMSFSSLIDSDIGPNRFTNDSGATYDAHIVANGDECYGNRYYVGYKLDSDNDFSKIQMSNANVLYVIRGSNNSTISQPSAELRSGTAAYTVEKYKSVYNMQDNKIPFCDVYLDSSGNATITTWFSQSDQLLGAFSLRFVSPTANAVVAGTFCYDSSNITINKISSGGALGVSVGAAGDGRQSLSFSQVPTGSTVRGWVKQL